MPKIKTLLFLLAAGLSCFVVLTVLSTPEFCLETTSKSGTLSVPVNLASASSIRTADPRNSIKIAADYDASPGRLIRSMLPKANVLGPLTSTSIFVKEKNASGGFSTSILVRWAADKDVATPNIEWVNGGAYSGRGMSFVTPGREIS